MRITPVILLLALSSCASMVSRPAPNYVVFFAERSADLDQDARRVIASAAQDARQSHAQVVTVLGYSDSRGNPSTDLTLSQVRAQVVADALVAGGVASDTIRREGRGQTKRDPGVESRRVEIAVGE